MTASAVSFSPETSAPVYLFWNGAVEIDAPPSRVWPHILAYPTWQEFSIVERLAGAPGEESEVVLLKKIEAGFDFPPYYARTIKVEPERRFIWKTYAHESSDMGFFGIVDFWLTPAGSGTLFNYSILYEFALQGASEAELADFKASQFEASQAVFDSIFPKLKRLSETGRL